MIFVTVGSQMPFDRLVRVVDAWGGRNSRTDVFAQIGPSEYTPATIGWTKFLEPSQFRARVRECTAMVAHAGMGSILTALEFGKPILVMPRRGNLMETRNDHQVATATRFRALRKVHVAMDESELLSMLDRLGEFEAGGVIDRYASSDLLDTVRSFIHSIPGRGQVIESKIPLLRPTMVPAPVEPAFEPAGVHEKVR